MITKLFSMRDAAAEIYNIPFAKGTFAEAERDFRTAINNPQSGHLHTYPEHYDLYFIGEYDDQTGCVTPLDTPKHVCKGIDLKDGLTPTAPVSEFRKTNPKRSQRPTIKL